MNISTKFGDLKCPNSPEGEKEEGEQYFSQSSLMDQLDRKCKKTGPTSRSRDMALYGEVENNSLHGAHTSLEMSPRCILQFEISKIVIDHMHK
jgi:hypothetical protein